jgi:hypothetical protein
MAISKITTDYSGRKKDVSIIRNINPTNPATQKVTLEFGKVSAYCAGVQKLVQRYMIIFMTEVGTQKSYPEFGTPFYGNIRRGNVVNKTDLVHKFNFANLKTVETIRTHQQKFNDIPLDEQINTALLGDIIFVARDQINIRILIKTNAGDNVDFLMPLPL